jgi:hypothetical protein
MSYPDFGHIGFKIICSYFMFRTVMHFNYRENYMQQKFNQQKQMIEFMEKSNDKMNKKLA